MKAIDTTDGVFEPGQSGSVCWCQALIKPVSWTLGGVLLAAVAVAVVTAAGSGSTTCHRSR